MVRRIVSLCLVLTTMSSSVYASQDTDTLTSHRQLVKTIRSIGVRVYLNPAQYCTNNIDGKYIPGTRSIVVCQDSSIPGGKESVWSPNDLDTLRHEAHHILQDCLGGGIGNGRFRMYYGNKDSLAEVLRNSGLSNGEMESIMERYRGGPLADKVLIELEAYAVARSVRADHIANELRWACGTK